MVKDASLTVAIAFERPGPCSAMGGGRIRNGSAPDAMADTKVHAGVVWGRKGGRSWSNVEVAIGGRVVTLIL